jgi:glycosyltransferase involved in cell wall biosynthesis
MPMRNAASFVHSSLLSILEERSVPLEVIVVDDGSTDNSRAIIEAIGDSRIRVIDGPCQGIAAALNLAIEAAIGDILMRCDADDLYEPDRIARQASWLRTNPEFGAICGGFSAMNGKGRFRVPLFTGKAAEEITEELRRGETRTHFCAFAIRSSVLKKLPARAYFRTGEDVDMQLRIGEQCRVWYDHTPAYRYRLHDASITHSDGPQLNVFYEEQARAFQRQRLATGTDALDRGEPPEPKVIGRGAAASQMHVQNLLRAAAWNALEHGRPATAIWCGVRAVASGPTSLTSWRDLLVVTCKIARQFIPAARLKLIGATPGS